MVDDLLEIADNQGDDGDDRARVNRDRLRVDVRKWILSKLAPKRYGDRLALAGVADSPLQVEMSDVQAAHEITRILAIAQKRKAEEERRARTADGEAKERKST